MKEHDNSLKILELPSWYLPEGGEFVQMQADSLRRAGVTVAVAANVALSWRKHKWKVPFFPHRIFSIYEKGILTYRHYTRRIPLATDANVALWIDNAVRLCEEYIKEQGLPQLIHVHSAMWAGKVALILKRRYNVPYVITEHRGRFSEKSDPSVLSIDEKYDADLSEIFSNAEMILPVSSLLIPKISSFVKNGVPISVVSNMLDDSFFHFEPKSLHPSFRFICVNHYQFLKGYDLLLQAFDIVAEKFPDIQLQIVGNGFDSAAFAQHLGKCKNASKIQFLGALDAENVAKSLHNADCFLLPSRVESQSISTLEAMACGLPAVATEVVPPEILTPNRGLRVPVNDVSAFANAMEMMIANHRYFDEESISKEILDIASKGNVTNRLLDIYKSIIYA